MLTELRVSKKYGQQAKYAAIMPIFFFVFILVYEPFSFKELYTVGGKSWYFHLLMISCIMAGVYALTRLVFWAIYRHVDFLWWQYSIWCLGEVLVFSMFMAMYTTLFHLNDNPIPYFTSLSLCVQMTALTLVYPYIIAVLSRIIINKNYDLEHAADEKDISLMKFYDEHKRLKLTISPLAILYISADGNNIIIHFLENDRVRSFQLRNTMKSLEADSAKHGLVRCHRSYYVNPRWIRLLGKSKDGVIYAEFSRQDVERIPVGKQYYDNLSNLL